MFLSVYYDSIFYGIGFIMNFIICISQSKNIINFVLTFQNVHGFLNNGQSSRRFVFCNWIIVIAFLCGYNIFAISLNVYMQIPFLFIYLCSLTTVFDINILYATRVLNLLKIKIVEWNDRALSHLKMGISDNSCYCSQMFQSYVNIMRCYNLYKLCFQSFVSISYCLYL